MKVLVDNVAVQAIEACLMTHLPDIISPASVMQMDEETIRRIAAESDESQELRGSSFFFPSFSQVTSSSKLLYLYKELSFAPSSRTNRLTLFQPQNSSTAKRQS